MALCPRLCTAGVTHSTFRTQVRILDMVSNPVPDARRASPGILEGAPHRPFATPPYGCVGGRWRRGRIIEWVRQLDCEDWACVIMADEPVSGPPWQGRYAFDPGASAPATRTSHRLGIAIDYLKAVSCMAARICTTGRRTRGKTLVDS